MEMNAHKLHGVLNGIDMDRYDPAKDPRLENHFSVKRMEGKGRCKEELQRQAQFLADKLRASGVNADILPCESQVGGGSLPGVTLPSFAVSPRGDANAWEEKLRRLYIIGRIHEGRFLLDVRTLRPGDESVITNALEALSE